MDPTIFWNYSWYSKKNRSWISGYQGISELQLQEKSNRNRVSPPQFQGSTCFPVAVVFLWAWTTTFKNFGVQQTLVNTPKATWSVSTASFKTILRVCAWVDGNSSCVDDTNDDQTDSKRCRLPDISQRGNKTNSPWALKETKVQPIAKSSLSSPSFCLIGTIPT